MRQVLFLVVSLIIISSCKKDQRCACFESTGKDTKIEYQLNDFDEIELSNDINLYIIQDTMNKIIFSGGENVLKGVSAECNNGKLFIKNSNKCNWTRSYKRKINAILSLKKLNNIIFRGSGNIKMLNSLHTDTFTINCWESSGDIEIKLSVYEAHINVHTGTSNIKVEGSVKNNYIYNFSYGEIDCINLQSSNVYATHRGTNNIYVCAKEILDVKIRYIGDIYYLGEPNILEVVNEGSGKLIKIE